MKIFKQKKKSNPDEQNQKEEKKQVNQEISRNQKIQKSVTSRRKREKYIMEE